jgi:hypothetical protein
VECPCIGDKQSLLPLVGVKAVETVLIILVKSNEEMNMLAAVMLNCQGTNFQQILKHKGFCFYTGRII